MNTTVGPHESRIINGVPSLDGKRYLLASADYPYYRDDVENWPDRIDKLKAMGCEMVTFYIPWRHHDLRADGRRELDFTGRTQANRNLLGFLDLCRATGMKAIVKPGPFIHAETNYGGLPDYVCPLNNPEIEPMLGGDGRPFTWAGSELAADGQSLIPWPLPAPLDPSFLGEVQDWYAQVRHLLLPYLYPDGPVVMVQIANEGIYSNHQRAPWAYDYSRSGLAFFHQFLQERYASLDTYNRRHATQFRSWSQIDPPRGQTRPASLRAALAYADWAAYQAVYMRRIYDLLAGYLNLDIPLVLNVNPPTDDDFGADAWLCRINPDEWSSVHYGFTNWIGVACDQPDVVDRYQVMVKRDRGFNLEENWGFSKLYEPEFAYASVSFYQTLLAIASGGTGYNLYTGVGTDRADPEIDRLNQGVYPDCAPVDETGRITPKGELAGLLNRFFGRWGEDFLSTRPVRSVAWGLYLPYAHNAVWLPKTGQEQADDPELPECGRPLLRFFRQVRRSHLDADLVNLQAASGEILGRHPYLVLQTGRWMDRETQEKLRGYVQAGGRLVLIGKAPEFDENLEPCGLLEDLESRVLRMPEVSLEGNELVEALFAGGLNAPVRPLNPAAAESMAWLYTHPDKDAQYLFLLRGREEVGPAELLISSGGKESRMSVLLPRSSAGVLRLEKGRVSAALLNGENDYLGETVTPECCVDGTLTQAPHPGNWLMA